MSQEKTWEGLEGNESWNLEDVVSLLSIKNYSTDYYKLMHKANELSRESYNNRAYVFVQLGLNSEPCTKNCKFCPLGKNHFCAETTYHKTEEEIMEDVRKLSKRTDIHSFFLMTTADYDFPSYLSIARRVRAVLPKSVKLVANIGDFSLKMGQELKEVGFTGAYHICRLGEGLDTDISLQTRIRTLDLIEKLGLDLYYCVEPIGPEHSYEAIAEEILRAKKYKVRYMAAMRRIPIPGTPLYDRGMITCSELIKVAAVCRIVVNPDTSMNVHETVQGAFLAGVNQVYAEYGTNPRDVKKDTEKSRGFSIQKAIDLLEDADYVVSS